MTDREIVNGLLSRDEKITRLFFFVKCRPLIYSIIGKFFPYAVDYDEMVNELYLALMDKDGQALRSFQFKSSLYQWLKRVAYNYFSDRKKREIMVEEQSKETPYEVEVSDDDVRDLVPGYTDDGKTARLDISVLLSSMKNKRYRMVLEKTLLEGVDYDDLSAQTGISKANLYNIKKRAMMELTQIALNEKR